MMLKNSIYSFLTFVLLLFVTLSCNKQDTAYTVTGKVENVTDSLFFVTRETKDSLFIDTIRIGLDGEFKFSNKIDTLTAISLHFKENSDKPYIVLVDKGWTVEVRGDLAMPDMIMAKGGSTNNDLAKFYNDNIENLKSRSELVNEKKATLQIDSLPTVIPITGQKTSVELKNINFDLLNSVASYVKGNPSKVASVILINRFLKHEATLDRLSESLNHLTGEAYDFPLAVQLRAYESKMKKSAVGERAPLFNREDINGKKINLYDYRGKYVLLSFVSTTCKICQDMYPHVVKEYDILKKEKMEIEFITIVKDIEKIPLLKENRKRAKWTAIPEGGGYSSRLFEEYNVQKIPYSILISKEGTILERDVVVYNLKNKLESYPNIKAKK